MIAKYIQGMDINLPEYKDEKANIEVEEIIVAKKGTRNQFNNGVNVKINNEIKIKEEQ